MNWKRINPWLRLRDLYRDMNELEYRIRQAERVAFEKASAHFDERTRYLQQHNEQLMRALAESAPLELPPQVIW